MRGNLSTPVTSNARPRFRAAIRASGTREDSQGPRVVQATFGNRPKMPVQAIRLDEPVAQQMESKICVVHISRRRCKGANFRMNGNDVDIADVVMSSISVCRLTQRSLDL